MASQTLASQSTDTEALNVALRSLELTRPQREALRMILAGHLYDDIRERLGCRVATATNAILADQLSPQHRELLMQKCERASRRLIAERAVKARDWWPDYKALTAEIERLKSILRMRRIADPQAVQTSRQWATAINAAPIAITAR